MNAIVAVSADWGIGSNGKLLFHIPEDMASFRAKTKGGVVVMGRLTLESLPGGKPLPERENVVLSSRPGFFIPGAVTVRDTDEALGVLQGYEPDEVFVIGGGKVYAEFLPYCSLAYVTKIFAVPGETDTYFPNLDENPDWELIYAGDEREHNGLRFQFLTYQNLHCLI